MYDDVQPEIRTLLSSVEKIKLDSSSIARLCYRSSPLLSHRYGSSYQPTSPKLKIKRILYTLVLQKER
ncbi:hypothetical protein CIRG_01171 [Coccidioides immitis RMSCC 2394]|uniref:Uncharacterized protein n=1 Tax=Coccidioides immitis RMSCC 2394 TaxID=404692 RepID=A0A0J6XXT3_COCIT|nr:hypothetical protein CIRG_01171 [Coccidioides immitis RMSCC 2394]